MCLYLICAEYEFETFGSTGDEIRLMAFCLHTDVIDVGLETIRSISDKIVIITNDFSLPALIISYKHDLIKQTKIVS